MEEVPTTNRTTFLGPFFAPRDRCLVRSQHYWCFLQRFAPRAWRYHLKVEQRSRDKSVESYHLSHTWHEKNVQEWITEDRWQVSTEMILMSPLFIAGVFKVYEGNSLRNLRKRNKAGPVSVQHFLPCIWVPAVRCYALADWFARPRFARHSLYSLPVIAATTDAQDFAGFGSLAGHDNHTAWHVLPTDEVASIPLKWPPALQNYFWESRLE